ncbi:MAG: YfhO family protein [Eubacteriales bacterium]|nr:YfhO family protein [Eubacteriales bacterium]
MKKKLSMAQKRICRWAVENKICFFSFLLPFLSMLAIFIGNGIYPFGDESFMHSDMYHQYVPFLEEFIRKVQAGEPLFYSWNIGMGSNYLALYVYYSASPFNWLMLLVPTQYLIEFMSYMVIFKIGLCGFTFAYYLKERFRTAHYLILFFSLFYAMSGFVAAYNWNVMWMDCLFLAPLILLGLERLVKDRKCGLYCVTLALSILSNYYISIMICIFLCLYFLVLLPEIAAGENFRTTLKNVGSAVGRFALYSLLAGGMAAVLLLPELSAIFFTEFSESAFPEKVTYYFSFLDVLARHATGVTTETGLDHWPNIFCSSAVFFLIPLYMINGNIKNREKTGRLLLCAFLIVSFSTNVLNFIWHGFNYPDSLPARQSFLYIFLVLVMCFEGVYKWKGFSAAQVLRCMAFGLFFLLLSEKLVEDDAFSTGIFLLSAAFVCVYALLLYVYRTKHAHSALIRMVAIAALALVTFEATFNMAYTSVSTTSRSKYLESLPDYKALAERIQKADPDFYRFEKFSRVTKNDGTLVGYPTASLFSSTANANVEAWYDRMGMSESKVFYCFDGQTPLSSALLNVRYMFSRSDQEDPSLYTLIDEENGVYLYRNNYTLPAGFILSDRWNLSSAICEISASDPFDLQNRMAASVGSGSLFEAVELLEFNDEAQFTADVSGHYYAYCQNSKADNVSVSSYILNKTFKKVKYDYILDLGWHEAGDQITLKNEDGGALDAIAARLNTDALSETLGRIGEQPFVVDSHDSGYVSGHVTVTTPGKLILSIAYEPGWSLWVDGEKTEIDPYDEMFISTDLSAGEHTIELRFFPAGLKAGFFISILSLAAFLFLQTARKKR